MPTVSFLEAVCASCLSQAWVDSTQYVHWSRHLLACRHVITGATLLVGARAITFNPHFQYFQSPEPGDLLLGAVDTWPAVTALLVLDSWDSALRPDLLLRASSHTSAVWILRQDCPAAASARDLQSLQRLGARMCAQIPRKSLVQHSATCWSES